MSSEIKIDSDGPSRQVLAEVPGRALRFLSAAGKSRQIRALLRERGYTDEEHRDGWDRLHRASGFGIGEPDEVEDAEVGRAITELDAWDEPYVRLIRAALQRRHPAQEKFVFDNLAPQVGAAAVVSVKTLLDRLDALEKSPARKATRKEDHAALETLAKRGITKQERSRLRQLVDTASGAGAAVEEQARTRPAAPSRRGRSSPARSTSRRSAPSTPGTASGPRRPAPSSSGATSWSGSASRTAR
ncbi:hypothetical protein [Sorangium cellulosum]|uniref:hypothetical protein n=1 Tax=Sorangium cellulosum TaxID=56 RepID=UPI0010122F00|nr:hypothetical protein [Sorangium cellulosum]